MLFYKLLLKNYEVTQGFSKFSNSKINFAERNKFLHFRIEFKLHVCLQSNFETYDLFYFSVIYKTNLLESEN